MFRPWRTWMLATSVAALTAALGVTFGVTGLAVTLAAVVICSVAIRIPLLARAG